MNGQDLFVGSISILLGAAGLATALFNWNWCYRLRKARWLENYCGRGGVRCAYAVLGVLLIVLGVIIAAGFRLYGRSYAAPDITMKPIRAIHIAGRGNGEVGVEDIGLGAV